MLKSGLAEGDSVDSSFERFSDRHNRAALLKILYTILWCAYDSVYDWEELRRDFSEKGIALREIAIRFLNWSQICPVFQTSPIKNWHQTQAPNLQPNTTEVIHCNRNFDFHTIFVQYDLLRFEVRGDFNTPHVDLVWYLLLISTCITWETY